MATPTFDTAPFIAWIDLETTGLDPHEHDVLEVALVLTHGPALDVVVARSALVTPHGRSVGDVIANMEPVVVDMHEQSGLLHDLATGPTISLAEADEVFSRIIVDNTDGVKPHVGGSSVTFDRGFMEVQLPALAGTLSHRNMDMTSVNHFVSSFMSVPTRTSPTLTPHRALDDLYQDIGQFRLVGSVLESYVEMAWRYPAQDSAETRTTSNGCVRENNQ